MVGSKSIAAGEFCLFLILIEVELIYNVVLVTAVQQIDSVVHIYIFF